jgi:hypothetical protein
MLTLLALAGISACCLSACGTVTSPPGGSASGGSASGGSASGGSASPAGTATVPASPGPTQPTPQPSISGSAVLTVTSNGTVVRLATGQSVTVILRRSALSWHIPAVTGAAVRRTSASGGYPGSAPAQATFQAVRPGHAILSAADDAACLHSQPACMMPQQLWRVEVIVTR